MALVVIEGIELLHVELILEFVSFSIKGFGILTPKILDLTELVHGSSKPYVKEPYEIGIDGLPLQKFIDDEQNDEDDEFVKTTNSKTRRLSKAKALKCHYDEIFIIFFPTVFLKNVKYRCKLREITMNRVRRNFVCLDITLQKSQKFVRHCFVRKPRVRCILQQRFVL